MKLYTVGTILTNRLGYCKDDVNKAKRRTARDKRGGFKMARAVDVPSTIALSWTDTKPEHFLATGAAGCEFSVNRRHRGGDLEAAPCPAIVSDYHRLMGGVDRHDQLRLQRYSLQTCHRFQKYYNSIFMGLLDLVIVNCYVTHVKCANDLGVKPMTRAAFMNELHLQLIKQVASDFEQDEPATPSSRASRTDHTIEQNSEFRITGNQRMRWRDTCKVCLIKYRQKGQMSNETSWYCVQCSEDNKCLLLCNVIRATQGATKTCFDAWHQDWKYKVPATAKANIQMRPTTGARKNKRVRRSLHHEEKRDTSDDENE